jgi:hypothetical protein
VDMQFVGGQVRPIGTGLRGRGLYRGVDILYHAIDDHLEYDSTGKPLVRPVRLEQA